MYHDWIDLYNYVFQFYVRIKYMVHPMWHSAGPHKTKAPSQFQFNKRCNDWSCAMAQSCARIKIAYLN